MLDDVGSGRGSGSTHEQAATYQGGPAIHLTSSRHDRDRARPRPSGYGMDLDGHGQGASGQVTGIDR